MKKIIIFVFIMICSTAVLKAEDFKYNFSGGSNLSLINGNENKGFLNISLRDSWFGRDKMHHFITSAFLSTAGYYCCREGNGWSNSNAIKGGVSFSFSIGLLKEIRDGRKSGNIFSVKDLVADVAGIVVGIMIIRD